MGKARHGTCVVEVWQTVLLIHFGSQIQYQQISTAVHACMNQTVGAGEFSLQVTAGFDGVILCRQ